MRSKNLFILIIIFVISTTIVYAHEEDFATIKALIDTNPACDQLSRAQLEEIGEYYMEQMHPGDAHDLMHTMMGIEEGTPLHAQFHITLARRLYCRDPFATGNMMGLGGMMNMMGGNMMGLSGMNLQGGMMQGMMGTWGGSYGFGWGFWMLLSWLFGIGLLVLLYLLIIKLWRDLFNKKK